MSTDHKDPILDACLEEILSGLTPPDLTSRITQALSSEQNAAKRNGQDSGESVSVPSVREPNSAVPVPPPVHVAATAKSSDSKTQSFVGLKPKSSTARDARSKRARSNWMNLAIAGSLMAIAITLGVATIKFWRPETANPNLAETGTPNENSNRNGDLAVRDQDRDAPIKHQHSINDKPNQNNGGGSSIALEAPFGSDGNQHQPAYQPLDPSEKPPREADAQVIAAINGGLKRIWNEHKVTPAGPATDEEWCRRAFAKIIGRQPADSELAAFAVDKSPDKRTQLINSLLSDEKYSDEFTRYWSSVLAATLIGPNGSTRENNFATRDGLMAYLEQSLSENKPYDRLAFELISATGSNKPDAADFNGATNFHLARLNNNATQATVHTARIFLGRQVQCAQCHDHHDNEALTQNKFWEINAFFRQMDVEPDPQTGAIRLVNKDFVGEGNSPEDAEIYFEKPGGELQAAWPVFDGQSIATSGLIGDVDRRTELAQRITRSDDFSRTAVNRMWAHFHHYGLTRRVDDMGPHNPPSHPEVLAELSEQFVAHDFDMKSLIRWIAASDSFALSSDNPTDAAAVDNPASRGVALFSRYYSRQVEPKQVVDSLQLAAKALATGDVNARMSWYGSFAPNTDKNNPSGSIIAPVAVTLSHLIAQNDRELLRRMAQSEMSIDAKLEHVFMAALARQPNKSELKLAQQIHESNGGDSLSTLEAVWLVLIHSNEFLLEN